jgi:hypothetical protein
VAAARLADVGPRDPQPLEVPRPLQHPLQQLAVAGLELLPLAQGGASRADARGEGVANQLQATELERAVAIARGRHPRVDLESREGLGDERRELALEAADLPPQLGAGEPLVAADADLGPGVSVEQMRHNPIPSVDHAASSVAATIHSASSTAIWGTPWTWIAATAIRRVSLPTS